MEFQMAFLVQLARYPFLVALNLLRDCREDIRTLGWERAMEKWRRFIS